MRFYQVLHDFFLSLVDSDPIKVDVVIVDELCVILVLSWTNFLNNSKVGQLMLTDIGFNHFAA